MLVRPSPGERGRHRAGESAFQLPDGSAAERVKQASGTIPGWSAGSAISLIIPVSSLLDPRSQRLPGGNSLLSPSARICRATYEPELTCFSFQCCTISSWHDAL